MERLIGGIAIVALAIVALVVVLGFIRLALENWGYLLLALIAALGVGYLVYASRRQG